jgi:hypothetical protein
VNAINRDSSAGSSVPVSFAFAHQESFVCKLSAPLSVTSRSLELVGGAHATILAPSFSNLNEFSISLWIKASPSIEYGLWTNLLAMSNGFSISITHSGQSSASGPLAQIKFCAHVFVNGVSIERCVFSTFLSITNLWTHIFAGAKGASGLIVLAVNGQEPYSSLNVQFDMNVISTVIVLGQNPIPDIRVIPFDGLIDNVRIFSTFVSSTMISELYQRSFSSYPPNNLIMSLTFDDGNGLDEVSGQTISIQMMPFSSMKGSWYSDCVQLASGNSFSYTTLYNQSHYVTRLSDSASSSPIRYYLSHATINM